MINSEAEGGDPQKKVRVLEIIGPAGAGKTTLYKGLGEHSEFIRLSGFPNVRSVLDAPFFIKYGLQLIAKILRLSRHDSRRLSRREFAWMSILIGWPNVLKGDLKKSSRVIVLDQGPVYLLAEMREFGPKYLRASGAEEFWQGLYRRWAATLDMIVWLDAADADLLDRIRSRPQDHIVKNESASTMIEFLDSYRKIYDSTVLALSANNSRLRVLKFNTGAQPTQAIIDRLLLEIK